MDARKKSNILKLFGNGIAASLLSSILLINILPAYQSMPITDTHITVFYLFLSALMLYFSGVCWLHMQHRALFKIIIIPALLLLSVIVGLGINNLVLTPLFLSVSILNALIQHWIYNMFWLLLFSTSLAFPIVFYIERMFFKWVRG